MVRKLKYIISLLLLLVFLLPTIIILAHHHEHANHHEKCTCKAGKEKHFHEFHEKCSICNFEFASFLSSAENIDLQKETPADRYSNHYSSHYRYSLSQYSFLLRAPPEKQI